MCTQRSPYNWSRELYQRHGETMDTYLTNNVLPALRDKMGQGGTVFLPELQRQWKIFGVFARKVNRIFIFLNRYYVMHHAVPALSQVCDLAFQNHAYAAIVGFINEERKRLGTTSTVAAADHHGMDHLDLHSAMDMVEQFHNNDDHKLEQLIFDSTRKYYLRKRSEWITHVEYFVLVKTAIEQEEKRFGTEMLNGIGLKIKAFLEEELFDQQEGVFALAEFYVQRENGKRSRLV